MTSPNILQLNPAIPVYVTENPNGYPVGEGYALFLTDYNQEHHSLFKVAYTDLAGQLWDVPQPYVRLQNNPSLERGTLQMWSLKPGDTNDA